MKSRIEHILDSHVNVKSKDIRDLMHEPARMEMLEGLPERPPEEQN